MRMVNIRLNSLSASLPNAGSGSFNGGFGGGTDGLVDLML